MRTIHQPRRTIGWGRFEENEDEHAGQGAEAGKASGVLTGEAAEDSKEEGDGTHEKKHLGDRELEPGLFLLGLRDDFVDVSRRDGRLAVNTRRFGQSDWVRLIRFCRSSVPVRFVDHDLPGQFVVTFTLAQ
jgi:hypothetical protein